MGSVAMIYTYIESLKSWFRHSKAVKGNTQTYGEQEDFISLFLFYFESKKNRVKVSFGKARRIINYIM
jgi:hypothetical protein